MITSQPTLWDSIAPVLDHMAMIADEEEGSAVAQIKLHADQAVGVAWQVVEGDALAEIEGAVVEGLPVASVAVSLGRC